MKILLLFLAMPILEVAMFVKIGGEIGALWTVVLTVGTAFLGAFLVRTQGIRTLFNVKEQLAQGQMPAAAMVEGIILLVCGALLLTPGFISDTIGFLGLVPSIRNTFANRIVKRVMVSQVRAGQSFQEHNSANTDFDGSKRPTTIDGHYTRED